MIHTQQETLSVNDDFQSFTKHPPSAGRSLGSFVGGYLMASYGTTTTYRAIGIASGVAGILYAITYYCCLRGHIKRRENGQGQRGQDMIMHEKDSSLTGTLFRRFMSIRLLI